MFRRPAWGNFSHFFAFVFFLGYLSHHAFLSTFFDFPSILERLGGFGEDFERICRSFFGFLLKMPIL